MSTATINELVAGTAGLFGLGLYAGLILRPAWTSYSRLWERVAATVLSLYVLAVPATNSLIVAVLIVRSR